MRYDSLLFFAKRQQAEIPPVRRRFAELQITRSSERKPRLIPHIGGDKITNQKDL